MLDMLFQWAYLRTGSLWLPIGIHFAWNLLQDNLLNLPGERAGDALFGLATRQQGPGWIVGTSYGIEVGFAGVLGVIAALAGIWVWTDRRNQQTLVFEEHRQEAEWIARISFAS